jgi:hypothetical protein
MRKLAAVVVLALASLASGCANLTVGHPIDAGKVATIVAGRSNKDFVKTTFGVPLHTVNGPDGDIWVYRYLNDGKRSQELCVSFNGDVVSVFSHE